MLDCIFRISVVVFCYGSVVLGSTAVTPAADNSKVNKRDSSVTEPTADQQPMNKSDTEITRLIRQEIMKDDSLSTYAHNVKIITDHGLVTLKGPVRTGDEKQKVVVIATRIAGNKAVINELEIVP